MRNTEAMISMNRNTNATKLRLALQCISDMQSEKQQVVVCELTKRTGLSRSFFYNNKEVREAVKKAQELQGGKSFVAPQKVAIDKALEKRVDMLERQLNEKEKENENLKKTVVKYKKMADAKTISIIENL